MRIVIRLLSCVVLASSAITVWARAAVAFVLGPQLTAACLGIAAGGSVCAVITLALTRKPNTPRSYQPPRQPPAGAMHRDRAAAAAMNDRHTRQADRQP